MTCTQPEACGEYCTCKSYSGVCEEVARAPQAKGEAMSREHKRFTSWVDHEAWHRGKSEGKAAERARIVAWLRARKEQIRLTGIGEYLDAIERGEHEDK